MRVHGVCGGGSDNLPPFRASRFPTLQAPELDRPMNASMLARQAGWPDALHLAAVATPRRAIVASCALRPALRAPPRHSLSPWYRYNLRN